MKTQLIKQNLQNIENGDYSPRFDESYTDDDKHLFFKTFNKVLKRLEEKDKESKKNRNGIERIPVPMLIFDSSFNIKEANSAFFKQSGYSRDYILRINAGDIKLSNIEGDSFMAIKELKKGGTAIMSVEIPSGAKIIKRHLIPSLNEGGEITGYFGIYFDITESEAAKKDAEYLREMTIFYQKNLKKALSTLKAISSGDLSSETGIPESGHSEKFQTASANLTALYSEIEKIRSDYSAIPEISDIMAGAAANDFTRKLNGNYTGGLKEIADSTNKMIDNILLIQETAEEIADGDLRKLSLYKNIGKKSESDRIVPAFTKLMENFNEMAEEAKFLSDAATEGKLGLKAHINNFNGEYKTVVYSFVHVISLLLKPINEARRMAEELSKGDYSTRFDENINAKGDFLNFKNELNSIAIEGTDIIKKIQSVSSDVHINASEVSSGAGEISDAVERVALNSQKGAELTKKLMSEIKSVSGQIAEFSSANEQITTNSRDALEGALLIVKEGEEARKLGENTTKNMKVIKDITAKSVEDINQLTDQMQDIKNIITLITEIANQINLLSLNASIEAARAGEHGRSFAVVAEEVKNLAYETRDATTHIEEVIMRVETSSLNTSKAITIAHDEVTKSFSGVEKTIEALNTIVEGTNTAARSIDEITKTMEEQAEIAIKIVNAANSGEKLTEQVREQAEDLASLAEEASASTEEITGAIHEVSLLTKELENSASAFKI